MNIRRRSKRIALKKQMVPSTIVTKKRKMMEETNEDDGIVQRPRKKIKTTMETTENDLIVERPSKRMKKSVGDDDNLMQQLTGLMINAEKEPAQHDGPDLLDQDPTHKVIEGRLKGYEVVIVKAQGDTATVVLLLRNARGKQLQERLEKVVLNDSLQELDSYDMLAFAEDIEEEDEDETLVEQEKKKWQCPKCLAMISEENGICPEFVDGQQCGGTRKIEKPIGWGGCFGQVKPTWICKDCTNPNPMDRTECIVCNKSRY